MLTQLARPQWQSFFERLSPLLRANVVQVESSGIGVADRVPTDWVRLADLSYNAQNDVLEICVHGADRAIHRPAQIHLRQDAAWLQSIEIVDGEGKRDVIIFKEPLRLTDFVVLRPTP
jgi:hypothetical protein